MLLAHGLLVLAMDGSRMQLLRNRGTEARPDLEVIAADHRSSPHGHDLEKHEQEFAAAALTTATRTNPEAPLVLIAPPRMLGYLRDASSSVLARHIVASFHRDHANDSPAQICEFLMHEKH